jgi:hypothetical protein
MDTSNTGNMTWIQITEKLWGLVYILILLRLYELEINGLQLLRDKKQIAFLIIRDASSKFTSMISPPDLIPPCPVFLHLHGSGSGGI